MNKSKKVSTQIFFSALISYSYIVDSRALFLTESSGEVT